MSQPLSIAYDASLNALLSPGLANGFITADTNPSIEALCAELSRLVYRKFELDPQCDIDLQNTLKTMGLLKAGRLLCDAESGTQAMGVMSRDTRRAFLVFRGSDDVLAYWTNFQFLPEDWDSQSVPGGQVHRGFAKALNSVSKPIEQWLKDVEGAELIVTGHSLGAALATLAAARWPFKRLVTFGSPRVGNHAFVASLQCGITRYVGCCDFVTTVPPTALDYADAGPATYIDRDGGVHGKPIAMATFWDRLRARARYPIDHALRPLSVPVRDLADHAPINYLRALI